MLLSLETDNSNLLPPHHSPYLLLPSIHPTCYPLTHPSCCPLTHPTCYSLTHPTCCSHTHPCCTALTLAPPHSPLLLLLRIHPCSCSCSLTLAPAPPHSPLLSNQATDYYSPLRYRGLKRLKGKGLKEKV